ncbi:MAG TPA: hypothetical protein VG148_03205, partial [Pyrinomonadaceae bacterium]|nr:hypothetical protein [Pyrinomonadaceae bacterium]
MRRASPSSSSRASGRRAGAPAASKARSATTRCAKSPCPSRPTRCSATRRERTTWAGGPGSHAEDHTVYGRFGEEPPQRLVAVPLVARDKAVAVLYADSAGLDAEAVNLEALETLVRVAGMAVELLAARRHAPAEARPAHEAAPPPRP